ncbi:unnamed protein product, partial [Closterium sp. NIES-54]
TALLLLALTTTGATPLCNAATRSTTASAASATSSSSTTTAAATASTAAADTSTTTTTPTTTPTPSTASTTTSTAPATPTSARAPLALASAAAPARGRRNTDRLETTKVGRSSRSNRGQEGSGVAIFDLDYDAILAAMYVVSISAEGDCYLCVPPDPGIEATTLGASESAAPGVGEAALSGTASAQVLHTFTLDSGASRSFFRDCTTLLPLSRLVAVSLAYPSGGPVLAHSSTVLPCPAVPSGSLPGLHLPSFSTNLVSGADLQDAWVDQFTPGGQRVTHFSCTRTGRHLATFTRQPGSSLYTLTTVPPPVAESGQVAASG